MTTNASAPLAGLVARVDRLTENYDIWTTGRLLDEGLDIVRDHCWAISSSLYAQNGDSVALIRHRPSPPDGIEDHPHPDWFPWGLGGTNPERFLFIENAGLLPAMSGSSEQLADRGITSCAHLPILERGRPIGFLQVHWGETRLVWNDHAGRVMRTLARFLLRVGSGSDVDVRQR